SPDGQRLASASADTTVKVWDARPLTEEVRRRAEARIQRQAAEDCLRQGQWVEAIDHLDPWIAAQPDLWHAWYKRGQVHALLGQWDKARTDQVQVFKLNPDDLEITFEYAGVLLLAGDSAGYQRFCAHLLERGDKLKCLNHPGRRSYLV